MQKDIWLVQNNHVNSAELNKLKLTFFNYGWGTKSIKLRFLLLCEIAIIGPLIKEKKKEPVALQWRTTKQQ